MPETQNYKQNLAYIASRIPCLSETFVWREILGLRERGWSVLAVSLYPATAHDPEWQGSRLVLYDRGLISLFWQSALEFGRHPHRALAMLATALADCFDCQESLPGLARLKNLAQAWLSLGLARQLIRRNIQHVHAHFAHAPTTFAMYAAQYAGMTFSFTGHANDLFCRRAFLREKLERAAFVSCISRWHQQFYREIHPAGAAKFLLIRCGVNIGKETPSFPEVKPKDSPFRFITVARLIPKKGIDILIRAFAKINAQDGSHAELHVIGDGPERACLETLARESGCKTSIYWHGEIPNEKIPVFLKSSDCFVLPCRIAADGDRDGIPVALMEAMACGLPVIAGDLPTIRELISQGENGLLWCGQNPNDLTAMLSSLAQNNGQRIRLGLAARETIRQQYSLKTTLDRLEESFVRCLGNAPLPCRSTRRSRRYCLITPCRNEAAFAVQTIESIVNQTVLPDLWVLVDDGSSDATPQILKDYAQRYDWIRIIRRPDRGKRSLGTGVIQAFQTGLDSVNLEDFDYVGKLDLDLKLPPHYFEIQIQRMEANPRLGTCSGKAYLVTPTGSWVPESTGNEMSIGAAKFYRTACFRQIGGFVPSVMWDGIDCHRARMTGWIACSWDTPDLRFIHLRPMGSSDRNLIVGRFRHGSGQAYMGTTWVYALASACYRLWQRPPILGSLAILAGYLWHCLQRSAQYPDPEFRRFLRAYQWQALWLGKPEATRLLEQRQIYLWQPEKQAAWQQEVAA